MTCKAALRAEATGPFFACIDGRAVGDDVRGQLVGLHTPGPEAETVSRGGAHTPGLDSLNLAACISACTYGESLCVAGHTR